MAAPHDFLRPPAPSELADIVTLVRHAYRLQGAGGWTTEANLVQGPRITLGVLREWSRKDHHRVLVHAEGGRVLACCHLEVEDLGGTRAPPHAASVHFGLLAVDPAHQSRGLGTSVLASAEEIARQEMGATQLCLLVLSRRLEVIEWYERRGFYVREGRRRFQDVAPRSERPLVPLCFVTMSKDLAPPT